MSVAEQARSQVLQVFLDRFDGIPTDRNDPLLASLPDATGIAQSQVDLIVSPDGGATLFMAIKCAAGSLGSREREIVAAARLFDENYQIPFAAVSDGQTAIVLDTVSGKKVGEGMNAIPSKHEARRQLESIELQSFPKERREREKLIFRTYDSQNVNVQRNV